MDSLFDDEILDIDTFEDSLSDEASDTAVKQDITPRNNPDFFGHEQIEKGILDDYLANRLPHAIVLSGPMGVGKATFAYRLARFLLAQAQAQEESLFGDAAPVQSMHVSAEHPVFRRVASGGHADLITIEREFDEKKGRLKNEISIESIRRIPGFLRMTAAEGGWRVVIIDGAEYISRYNQNVLLKILEEPPSKTILILVTSQPGLLLTTIRSRCRIINFDFLPKTLMNKLLAEHAPVLSSDDRAVLELVADGSIGAAVHYSKNNGVGIYKDVMKLLGTVPSLDVQAVHDFAEKFSKSGSEQAYDTFRDLIVGLCEQYARKMQRGQATLHDPLSNVIASYAQRHFFDAWEKMSEYFQQAEMYNLDKRQAVIGAFLALQKPDFMPLQVRG